METFLMRAKHVPDHQHQTSYKRRLVQGSPKKRYVYILLALQLMVKLLCWVREEQPHSCVKSSAMACPSITALFTR